MDEPKKCRVCNGRGYHHCECWPGDCICGQDYEDCEECGGTGWIDPQFDFDDDWYDRHHDQADALEPPEIKS